MLGWSCLWGKNQRTTAGNPAVVRWLNSLEREADASVTPLPLLCFDEGYFGGDELILLAASQAKLYEVTYIEVAEVDAVEATVVEEGVLTRAYIDEAEARLEGIDLPAHESVVKLFA